MFAKILIANRGEIAVRIIQACRELGVATVAVYSDADVGALHVALADEAYHIGPPPALDSYLNIEALLSAARASGAEAVHPGYGFLSENASFARQVESAGLVWIGPAPHVIALMGDKVAAKELARSIDVPVVPGYYGDDQSSERMQHEAEVIGFPVMLKAAAGGGGRGMRAVHEPAALPEALQAARREARSAFGEDRVFLERLIRSPRHIEMQVVGDRVGNAIYLGERDCSIQRRHQKVLEEAPSPVMTQELRRSMGTDALRLVAASRYTNAGTIEFLFSNDRYYFLEMNTRIQVEHPVTEEVTGVDLVRLQIEIAAGNTLPIRQSDVRFRGHAIEVRVYAEDPQVGFLPATGIVEIFRPPLGPGIRNDVGVEAGSEVTPYYDPMLAKLIVHAPTRDRAIQRLQTALDRYVVTGLTSNLAFLSALAREQEFVQGRASTDLIDRTWTPRDASPLPDDALVLAGCWKVLVPTGEDSAGEEVDTPNPWLSTSAWRAAGAPRTFRFDVEGREVMVDVLREREHLVVAVDGGSPRTFRPNSTSRPSALIDENGRVMPLRVRSRPDGLRVEIDADEFTLAYPRDDAGVAGGSARHTNGSLTTPMPGRVIKVAVIEGQHVVPYEPLVVIEAMKMEHVIQAPHEGTIRAVFFHQGDMVPAGAPVVRLDRD